MVKLSFRNARVRSVRLPYGGFFVILMHHNVIDSKVFQSCHILQFDYPFLVQRFRQTHDGAQSGVAIFSGFNP